MNDSWRRRRRRGRRHRCRRDARLDVPRAARAFKDKQVIYRF